MENVMSAGYVIARENFKEAAKHVSAEADPIMFNLLYGLQSLTNQIEADFASLWSNLQDLSAPSLKKPERRKGPSKKKPNKRQAKRRRGAVGK
jgi:hypothetical protein